MILVPTTTSRPPLSVLGAVMGRASQRPHHHPPKGGWCGVDGRTEWALPEYLAVHPGAGRNVSFGSGSSKRSQKVQPTEGEESQPENLGRALPKLTKAPSKPVAQAPFDQFMAEWQVAAERVHTSFTKNGIKPSYETMQAATWLAFQLNEPWSSFRRISEVEAGDCFHAIVQGRCVAGLDDYGRVVIRNVPRAGARIVH